MNGHYLDHIKGIMDIIGMDSLTLEHLVSWLIKINGEWPNKGTGRVKRSTLKNILFYDFPEISSYKKKHMWIDATEMIPVADGKSFKHSRLPDWEFKKLMAGFNSKYKPIFQMIREKDLQVTQAIYQCGIKTESDRYPMRQEIAGIIARQGKRVLSKKLCCENLRPIL
jgi:hypothetical protein